MSEIPETRFAKSGDAHIAYQVIGDGPVDLVYVAGWISNVELNWQEPEYARFLTRIASFARVILFDKRGTGLSDRVSEDRLPTLEQRMDDVRAVMDAAGSDRAALFGVSEGGPMSVLFAAAHPDRTRALAMFGTYSWSGGAPEYEWTQSRRLAPRSPPRSSRAGAARSDWRFARRRRSTMRRSGPGGAPTSGTARVHARPSRSPR
jgi:pimeloyl-ACP methyl ester carboxylesterase